MDSANNIVVRVLCLAALAAAALATAAFAHSWSQTAGKGAGNDIKLHGHWVIEIRNADGSLASPNEFNNALENGVALSAAP